MMKFHLLQPLKYYWKRILKNKISGYQTIYLIVLILFSLILNAFKTAL